MSIYYILGLICGIVFGIGIVYFVFKKMNPNQIRYDERQMAARGVAYKYAFFALIAYVVFYSAITSYNPTLLAALGPIGMISGVFFSMVFFVIVCIFKDAYEGINENKNWPYLIAVIGIINFGLAFLNITRNGWFEDGAISVDVLNLECGILMIVVLIAFVVKKQLDKRED